MNIISNRSTRAAQSPLTLDQLQRNVPSAFAPARHESRSERYTYIPTVDVIRGMMAEGFVPFSAREARTRDVARRGYQKHIIRFRRDGAEFQGVNSTLPEIVLVNSHDGSSAYTLSAGLFRLVCLNGLVIADATFASLHIPHKGDVIGRVVDGAFQVIQASVRALEAPRAWAGIQLSQPERLLLAEAAHTVRFADADGNVATPIQPKQLLAPRRFEDDKSDLWSTFNVVQENATKGGLTAVGRNADNRARRTTTRAIGGIDQDMRLNKALWTLGEKMAALKG